MEHSNDLFPLFIGIIVSLLGAIVALVVYTFKSLKKSVDSLQLSIKKFQTIALYRIHWLDRRLVVIETKLGISVNGTTPPIPTELPADDNDILADDKE